MEFGFFILGLGIGIALPYAINALVDWMNNHPDNYIDNYGSN